MEEGHWSELSVNINHPWNKFAFGWEYFPPLEESFPYNTILIHVGMLTFIYDWGHHE